MINAQVFLGFPLKFGNICEVYPPTVNDVVGNKQFSIYMSMFCITQEDLDEEYGVYVNAGQIDKAPTPFEYLLSFAHNSSENEQICRDAFLLFTKQNISFLWEVGAIIIGDITDTILESGAIDDMFLKEENYFDFQNMIRMSLGQDPIEAPEDISALDPRIQRFKRLQRERDRVKAKQNAKDSPTLGTCLASICCMGIGLNPLTIGEISYASVNQLIGTFQKREKYDSDCTSLLLGADAKKIGFKYWINND